MNLARLFARLSIYRASRRAPLWVLVALAVGFYLLAGIGEANAQTTTSCSTSRSIATDDCDNGETARAASVAAAENMRTSGYNYGGATAVCTVLETPTGADPRWYSRVVWQSMGCTHGGFSGQHYRRTFSASAYCAAGNEWDADTKTCNPSGPSEEDCLNRNDAINNDSVMGGMITSQCVDGCVVGHQPGEDYEEVEYTIGGTVLNFMYGRVGFTGATCAGNDPPPDFSASEGCADVAGQTVCVTNTGKHCYAPKPGESTRFCWTPGETGEKASGDLIQVREPGDKTSAPTPPTAPPGETLTQTGDPVKGTTTINNTTVNTTTTSYTTQNGTDARPGTPSDADGDGDGNDDGDGEEGTASGGDTCASPPTSSDSVIGKVSEMVWRLRCAGEEGDSGLDPTIAGDQGDDAHPEVDSIFSTSDLATQVGQGGDDSGVPGMVRVCPLLELPDLEFRGNTVTLPWASICGALEILAGLILLAGHIQWAYIVGRIGSN